jgi:hypothetical protein
LVNNSKPKLSLRRAAPHRLHDVDEDTLLAELVELLAKHEVVKAIFRHFKVPVEQIFSIPLKLKEMDMSARAQDGIIYLNKKFVDEGEILELLPYAVHEITHVLQQRTGQADNQAIREQAHYLDRPEEVEAFRNQIALIEDLKGQKEARKYLEELLDFHNLKGSERKGKSKELWGDA